MVFNKEIQEYAQEKYGYSPKNGWIAHAKEFYGIPLNKAHNRDGERKWGCPKKRLEEFKKEIKTNSTSKRKLQLTI